MQSDRMRKKEEDSMTEKQNYQKRKGERKSDII